MKRNKMKNVTINLPDIFIDTLDEMALIGEIPSRSEGIRIGIRELLKTEHIFFQNLKINLKGMYKKRGLLQ